MLLNPRHNVLFFPINTTRVLGEITNERQKVFKLLFKLSLTLPIFKIQIRILLEHRYYSKSCCLNALQTKIRLFQWSTGIFKNLSTEISRKNSEIPFYSFFQEESIREELFIAYKTAWKFVASSINHLQVVVWILKYNPLSFPSFILLFIVPTHLQVSRTNRILIKPT